MSRVTPTSEPTDVQTEGASLAPAPAETLGTDKNPQDEKAKASKNGDNGKTLNPLTPAMRQYVEQKKQVGDAILLFRMGDFYETFFEDAKTIARVLGLTLTARNKDSADPIPLAGVPYHAVEGYIAKLVKAGFKVAISEQIEDPKLAKGVVQRDVQRIITPGTLTEDTLLDDQTDNFLAAVFPRGGNWNHDKIGLACVELASGRFFAEVLSKNAILDELVRLRPAELIVPEMAVDVSPSLLKEVREIVPLAVSPRPAYVFDAHVAEQTLKDHFRVSGMAGFGFDRFDESLCAAAAVLDYLQETQRAALGHILKILPRESDRSVMIDQVTLRSLEVERTLRDGSRDGSLLGAVDMTTNPMGGRRLREWLCFPLREPELIRQRQDAIADLIDQPERLRSLRQILRGTGDLERILARLGVGRASPRDMVNLGIALGRCRELGDAIGPAFAQSDETGGDLLSTLQAAVTGHDELAGFLAGALKEDAPAVVRDGGFIADGFDAELDRLRNIGREGHRWLAEFQAREAERAKIPSLKVGYNSVFGYYIEITHQHRDKIPPDYVRKQTLRNAERYITEELKHHETEVLGASDRAKQLEIRLFDGIRDRAADDLARLQATAEAVATLDVIAGLAELARQRGYCRPEMLIDDMPSGRAAGKNAARHAPRTLEIADGRHPVLDLTLAERFVPNDCRLEETGDLLLVITGPNMAGKSTYIRQVALLTLLAHTGSFVPAKSMRWHPVDRIFARVGASDELSRGHSTFMVEMVETARILNNATAQSLVILDEIGRGTSTYDGLALAWAITEHLSDKVGCRTLFATHYHELIELADQLAGVANYNVAVREELRPDGTGRDVVFLHKIISGATDRSYGVHVAAMAGLPPSVLKRSEAILQDLEHHFAATSRDATMSAKADTDSGQMMLFGQAPSLPSWWRDLVDEIGGVRVDETTPIQALSILHRLQKILHEQG